MEFAKTIDTESLNNLPLKSYEGRIHVVTNEHDLNQVLPLLRNHTVLGFDTETRPSFKKGMMNKVSLLQLATPYDVILIRLHHVGFHPEIKKILSDRKIVKVGAAIHDDLKSLKDMESFSPNGFVDLQDEVKRLEFECFSLKKMTAIILGFRISKSQQLSNWESEELTKQQQVYAATDAWVSLLMYQRLTNGDN